MRPFLTLLGAVILLALSLPVQAGPVQDILQEHSAIQPAIDALASSGLPQAQQVLEVWQAKDMWLRQEDGLSPHRRDAKHAGKAAGK